MSRSTFDPPITVALDVSSLDEAKRILDAIGRKLAIYKIGLQLFTAAGPAAVREVTSRGFDVFLDLKAHDIPNTVAGAVSSAAGIGARLMTIHGAGGRASIAAALDATVDGRPELLVVSVLTSLDQGDLTEFGVGRTISEQVDAVAELAAKEGAPGLVLGASEVPRVRANHPDLFLLVPGMRPGWSSTDDQKRTGTPKQAVADGADLIVLGRAITKADDPAAAVDRVLEEIQA
jgi:orotidine-5'-phosphate decarboxylase